MVGTERTLAAASRGRWRSALVLTRVLCETTFLGRLPTTLSGS
jgi:hypothetical protein